MWIISDIILGQTGGRVRFSTKSGFSVARNICAQFVSLEEAGNNKSITFPVEIKRSGYILENVAGSLLTTNESISELHNPMPSTIGRDENPFINSYSHASNKSFSANKNFLSTQMPILPIEKEIIDTNASKSSEKFGHRKSRE